jgi:hypothetical protein
MNKNWTIIAIAVAIWTIPWKGLALWKSAKRGDRAWFIVLLLVNTLAILEIIYLLFFSKEKSEDLDLVNPQNPKRIV